jgi:hypothetical protein
MFERGIGNAADSDRTGRRALRRPEQPVVPKVSLVRRAADGQQSPAVKINTTLMERDGSWVPLGGGTFVHLPLSNDPYRPLTVEYSCRERLVGSDTEEVTGSNPVAPTSHNAFLGPPLNAVCQQIVSRLSADHSL